MRCGDSRADRGSHDLFRADALGPVQGSTGRKERKTVRLQPRRGGLVDARARQSGGARTARTRREVGATHGLTGGARSTPIKLHRNLIFANDPRAAWKPSVATHDQTST